MALTRRATHAGTWYSVERNKLKCELQHWLGNVEYSHGPARAIIAPHAGYGYCGSCAAYAYRQIDPALVKRIFILGPSHYVKFEGCEVAACSTYETPLYDLHINRQICNELQETGHFGEMDVSRDEQEHSIEMQLPFIAKVMEMHKDNFTIIPILVGSLNWKKQELYGKILAPYLDDPQTLFVISSDFCHWGERFGFTLGYERYTGVSISQFIQHLDKQGMAAIESLLTGPFAVYMEEYANTICGRHPISVLLQATYWLKTKRDRKMNLKFLKYEQSNECNRKSDSSVSYASASLIFE